MRTFAFAAQPSRIPEYDPQMLRSQLQSQEEYICRQLVKFGQELSEVKSIVHKAADFSEQEGVRIESAFLAYLGSYTSISTLMDIIEQLYCSASAALSEINLGSSTLSKASLLVDAVRSYFGGTSGICSEVKHPLEALVEQMDQSIGALSTFGIQLEEASNTLPWP